MHEKLQNRPMSGFPVSIATGLALESIFDPVQEVYDPDRVVPNKIDRKSYNNYIFNVSTLVRNIINSVPSSDIFLIPNKDILDVLLDEITWLTEFFYSEELIINFYVNDYRYVKSKYEDKGVLRKISTDRQILIDNILKYCLEYVAKQDDVTLFSNDISYNREDQALIFTHVPWDLLSYKNFVKLDLLESHTGVVKSRKLWNTKYYPIPNRDMSFLPFTEKLLTVFGDHVMFKPASLKERIDLWSILKNKGVNPLTSDFALNLTLGN